MISRSARRRSRRERMGEGRFRTIQNIRKDRRRGERVLAEMHEVEQSIFRGATVRVAPDSKKWVSLRAIRTSLSTQMDRVSERIRRRAFNDSIAPATA